MLHQMQGAAQRDKIQSDQRPDTDTARTLLFTLLPRRVWTCLDATTGPNLALTELVKQFLVLTKRVY